MLDTSLQQQLAAYLTRLVHPLELHASLDDTPASAQMRELLEDIARASDRISVREHRTERAPSFGVARAGEAPRVFFAGLPLGHEFTSLVLALLWAGGHPPKESEETLEAARGLTGPLEFEAYISLSCHNCPDVVQALTLIATVNPAARLTVIDGALFQDEVAGRDIMAVPTVFLNGALFASGRMTVQEILARLDSNRASREAARLSDKAPFDVLVVGGGPAGSAAAVYAARKGIRTGVLAERFGGQTNDTLGIENYISVLETNGPKFAADLEAHVRHYGVDVMTAQRAARLVPASQAGGGSCFVPGTPESGSSPPGVEATDGMTPRYQTTHQTAQRKNRGARGVAVRMMRVPTAG